MASEAANREKHAPAFEGAAALGPFVIYGTSALIIGSLFGRWLDVGAAVAIPHFAVVASLVALFYLVTFSLVKVAQSSRWQAIAVAGASTGFSLALVIFYVAAVGSYLAFNEFPTRQLVSGYLRDLPSLLTALPVTRSTLALGLLVVVAAGVALGLLVARMLLAGRSALLRGSRSLAARVATYVAAAHLVAGFTMPLGWHVFNYEPVMSSWHNVRLTDAGAHGYRDPLEVALDAKVQASYPRLAAKRTPTVILVYIDALRADATQPYGAMRRNMPFLTSLLDAGAFIQVDLALAACPATSCGIPALLQSRPSLLQGPEYFSLPRLLALQGYRTAFVLASNHQDYLDLRQYYQPSDFYRDGKDLHPTKHANDYLVLDGLEQLGGPDGRPTFLMIGLISPHLNGIRAERNRIYAPDRISLVDGRDQYRVAYRNNYDNGVVQADDVLRRVWTWLTDNGYLDDAIVFITSDHGESLGEGGRFSHMHSVSQSELHIPLWVLDPAAPTRKIPFARQIDIAPTIVDSLGLPIPPTWHGRSLYRPSGEPLWSDHQMPGSRRQTAIVRHDSESTIKYIVDRAVNKEVAFDLRSDPREERDVFARLPEPLIQQFRARASGLSVK